MNDNDDVLSMEVTAADGEVVVAISGELDPHTAQELSDVLSPYHERGDVGRLVLDLSGVRFIDSSGLRVILSADQALADRDAMLVLRAPSDAARRLLEISSLLDRLHVE